MAHILIMNITKVKSFLAWYKHPNVTIKLVNTGIFLQHKTIQNIYHSKTLSYTHILHIILYFMCIKYEDKLQFSLMY